MKKFTMKLAFGTYENCYFVKNKFVNSKAMRLSIWDDDGPVCTVNVNANGIPEGSIAVKTWAENEGLDKALQAIGLIGTEPIGFAVLGGAAPVFKLNENVLEEYC